MFRNLLLWRPATTSSPSTHTLSTSHTQHKPYPHNNTHTHTSTHNPSTHSSHNTHTNTTLPTTLLQNILHSYNSSLPSAAATLTALLLLSPIPYARAETRPKTCSLSQIKSSCTRLHLENSNLSSLPEGIFQGLSNVWTLHLWGNNLSSLPEGIFQGLSNLQRLFLEDNNLSSLPEGIFQGLSNLQRLYLHDNNLSCMPELPSSLRKLYVHNDRSGPNDIHNHGLPPCGDDNRPPEVIRGIQDHSFPRPAIPDQNSPEAWASRNNLDNNFRDPDGDDLSFTATSSNPAKATVSVRGSTLTVSAVAEGGAGTATITVTASDGKDDGTASFSFTVNVRRVELQISKKTIQISDPINEIPFDTIVRKIADVASGKIFQRAAKRVPVTEEQKLLEAAERGVEAVQYEISKPSLLTQVPQLLNSGSPLWQTLQNELSRILDTYFDSYTVNLTANPQSSVTVRISSNHPDAFDISPETLTFTPDNWSQPQRVQVRLAFTIQNYINGEIPNLATLSHTTSSGANTDVQIGVTELRPIREHVYDALISFAPEIAPLVIQGLCGLNPVCGSFLLGRSIGNLITELIEDTVLDEALDTILEPIFKKISDH